MQSCWAGYAGRTSYRADFVQGSGVVDPIPKDVQERSQRRLLQYVASGATAGNIVNQSAALFLLSLGATPFFIGLLATVGSVSTASRALGVWLMPRFGKPRIMSWSRISSAFFTLLLIPLALLASGDTMVAAILALAIFGVRQFSMQLAGGAWWPIVQDNIGSDLSWFITKQRMAQRSVTIVVPLALGYYLGSEPGPRIFAAPYAVAAAALLLGAVLIRAVAERPTPISDDRLLARFIGVLRVSAMRRYCLCFSVCEFVHMATMPFWVIVLIAQGLPASYFVAMMSVMALGEFVTLYAWGRLVELYGGRGPLTLALFMQVCLAPMWLLLPDDGDTSLVIFVAIYYVMWGISVAGAGFGDTHAMVDSVPQENRGEAFTVATYAHAVGGALGGFSGGLFFEWASAGAWPADSQPELIYLVSMQLAILVGYGLSRRLVNHRHETPTPTLVRHVVTRPFRRGNPR